MSLPHLLALKTVYEGAPGKYLGYQSGGNLKGYLQYSSPVTSPIAKFALELASNGEGVHIRSCYNNKYWRRSSDSEYWIVAVASEKVEDESQWNCTLFKTKSVDYNGTAAVQFVHVQGGSTVCLSNDSGHNFCLCLDSLSSKPATSSVIDYDSLVILPTRVTFKGDNDKYLQAYWFQDHEYLQYGATDTGNINVANEVSYTVDGEARIKNVHWNKFWRITPGWIWADSSDTSANDVNTLFWVTKVDNNNVVALRCKGNNRFAVRIPDLDWKFDCLNAGGESIISTARMTVLEPVLTRSVNVVEFRVEDARIYNLTPIAVLTKSQKNTTAGTNQMELKATHNDARSRSWSNSISVGLSVSITFKAGIPLIAEEGIEVEGSFSDEYQWGETVEESQGIELSDTVEVPPRNHVTATMMTTQGTCDVPFSYQQIDTLTTGERVITTFEDGVSRGINAFGSYTVVTSEDVPPEEWTRL